jgi:glycerophosphoryl diester phosphodiesterase
VIPWTVNEPDDIRRVLGLGVDGIISDYPDRVKQALLESDQIRKRSP